MLIGGGSDGKADAAAVIEAALKKAHSMKAGVSIAVVDDGGYLVSFARTDDARLHSVNVALAKARSAALTRNATGKTTSRGRTLDDHEAIALTLAAGPDAVVTFPGGVPISANGKIVGAVGVSGAKGAEDRQIVEAGAAAI